ncbi:hypothetical protein [Mesorhizobium sp. DCY119]|uniref:hypothetical protein n=1 Tax=Mesorhizobium sp. DCY119 TaxID=2108445 RepID=UPI001403C43F|nr:hypothetical protein [Mesorhizobium sp. DCY119]
MILSWRDDEMSFRPVGRDEKFSSKKSIWLKQRKNPLVFAIASGRFGIMGAWNPTCP